MQDKINITAMRPFSSEIVSSQAPEGLSISQMLWNGPKPEKMPYTVRVWIDGREVQDSCLNMIFPRAGSVVMVKTLPKGGGNDLFRAVLMIAVIAASYYTGGLAGIAYGKYWGLAASMAVSTVGMLAVHALVPPQLPGIPDVGSDISEAPTLWVSGAKNRENRWGTVPVILGRNRTVPFYGAKPYTEIVGNDQFFRTVYVVGHGPLAIEEMKLGETPLSDFQDYQVEIRSGDTDDPPLTLYSKQTNEESLSILLKESHGWQGRNTTVDIDEFSVDWGFLSGLTQYDANGRRQERTVQLEGRYRKVGTEPWRSFGEYLDVHEQDVFLSPGHEVWGEGHHEYFPRDDFITVQKTDGRIRIVQGGSVPADCYGLAIVTVAGSGVSNIIDIRPEFISGMQVSSVSGLTIRIASGTVRDALRVTITGKTSQALRGSIAVVMPERAQYEVQLRRLTADTDDTRIVDQVHWITLRSIKNEYPINYPHPLALVALRIKITDQMSSSLEEFNCVATSIVKDYTPSNEQWTFRTTSNPSSIYRHVLQGNANPRPQGDEKLDLDWFADFWQFCVDKEFSFNAVFSSARSVYEQCLLVCSVARCSPQIIEGKWAGVIDREQSFIQGHYTPHNSWGFGFSGEYPELPHAWKVRFLDETNNWQELERIVYADGYNENNASLFESVNQVGITDPAQIWKLWRYHYACAKLRSFPFSFYADWEHLANTRGDLVRCTHYEIMGQVFTGRLKKVDQSGENHELTLDNAVIMEAGKNYGIRIRRNTGATLTGIVITEPGEHYIITIDGLLVQVPSEGDLFQFGEMDKESIPAIIKEIEPVDKLCARILCVDYSPAVYTADEGEVPEWNPVFTKPTPFKPEAPAVPRIISQDIEDVTTIRKPDGNYLLRVGISYIIESSELVRAEYVQVQYRPVGTEIWQTLSPIPAETGIFYISVEEPVQYEVRIRSVSRLGVTSDWSSIYVFDPGHKKVWDANEDELTDANNDEVIVKEKPRPPTITGLIATPQFKSVYFEWDASKDLFHFNYECRIKIASGEWSEWFFVSQPNYLRELTQEEIGTYGFDARIYVEVKDRNTFGQTSLISATASSQPLPIYGNNLDTTPPGIPIGLDLSTSVEMSADGHQLAYIQATWDASPEPDLSHYEYRVKVAGGNYVYGFVTTNSIKLGPIVANQTYYVGIRAIDRLENKSVFCADESIVSAKDTEAPATPSGLSAAGGIQYILLTWNWGVENDLSHYEIFRNTENNIPANPFADVKKNYFIDGNRTGGQTYYYWIKAVDNSGNKSNAAASVNATPRNIQTADVEVIAANKILIDGVVYLTNWRKTDDLTKIDGGLISAASVLANQITVAGGNSLANIDNWAGDPAGRINALTTKINPGLILVSGATTLSDWRHGSDLTKIDGGNIYANSITANKLSIGSRNLSIQGIEISANKPTGNTLYWAAGVISYTKDDGTTADVNISASNVLWTAGTLYLYWVKDATSLSTTTDRATAFGVNNVVLASYRGSIDLVVTYGRTIIDGSHILVNTITADRMNVATLSAIVANLGTITAGNITLDSSGYIRGGQTAYNTGTGFWLGYSDAAYKLSIGNPAGNYLTWDGAALILRGQIIIASGSSGIASLSDAGALATKNAVDLATAEVINKTADNISETAAKKWAGETGADVTATKTAAGISGQGALATLNAADFASQVSGAEKPANNATVGATWGTNLADRPIELTDGRVSTALHSQGYLQTKVIPGSNIGTPAGAGLSLGADYLGYYSGAAWAAYIDNTGKFKFRGDSDAKMIFWDGAALTIRGSLNADDIAAGTLAAARLSASIAYITNTAQIANAVITSAKIGNLEVKSANIDDLTVGTTKITGQAVTRGAEFYNAATINVAGDEVEIGTITVTTNESTDYVWIWARANVDKNPSMSDGKGGHINGATTLRLRRVSLTGTIVDQWTTKTELFDRAPWILMAIDQPGGSPGSKIYKFSAAPKYTYSGSWQGIVNHRRMMGLAKSK